MSQLMTDGLHSRTIHDLQDVKLEDLAGWTLDDASPIQDIVRQVVDGDGQPSVDETIFNSAIS
jgi:hypothetical protein